MGYRKQNEVQGTEVPYYMSTTKSEAGHLSTQRHKARGICNQRHGCRLQEKHVSVEVRDDCMIASTPIPLLKPGGPPFELSSPKSQYLQYSNVDIETGRHSPSSAIHLLVLAPQSVGYQYQIQNQTCLYCTTVYLRTNEYPP